jgi:NHLM bacteriocin system ABC transporter peptidase/ATP-binding protein
MEATECGAAALAIVLGYHGRMVALEELRIACGVSRDGSKANNLVKAARTYGLNAKGFAKPPESLPALPLPLIVFWNFNHFLVVEGFGRDKVYLNDPATGPRVVSSEEFDEAYTGVVLVFEPGPDFRCGGTRPNLFQALRARLTGSGVALSLVILATLTLLVPGLALPAFARIFVDQVLVGGVTGWLEPLLLGMALTAVVRGVLTWLQQFYLLRLETQLAIGTAGRFFWHVLQLPVAFFTQRYAGEIGARVALNDRVARLLAGKLATTLLSLFLIGFYLLLMLQHDLLLTLIGVGVALLNVVALALIARRRADGNRQLQHDRGKLLGTAYAGVEMIETLKATGAEADFFARWSGYHAKVLNAEQRLARFSQVLSVVPPLLSALNTAAILVVGGLRIMDGQMTIGVLVAFQSLMASFLQPVNQLVALGGTLQEVGADLSRLDDVLRYPRDSHGGEESGAVASSARLNGQIELRDVSFGYNPMDPPLIAGLSLSIPAGARVALVGGSGSGKSTVAKLVAGLYAPWSGELLYDGQPRHTLPRATFTSSLAVVGQEITLFAGTVRENLSLWDATISEAAIMRAAEDAAIHAEILVRPGGYDALIAEGGRDLSGGQRQRLELARALALDPTVLVLDEATSALDPLTEQQIDANLRRRGCTCLIVAHRLSTIRDADEILVLERGTVVQRGSHAELISRPGSYRLLVQSDEHLLETPPLSPVSAP